MDHPEFARPALAARPTGHHSLAVVERLLALLHEGGIPPGQAAWGLDLLLWVTARAAEHAADGAEPTD
jgi:Tetracyclin repressor-like, C-terminal domain